MNNRILTAACVLAMLLILSTAMTVSAAGTATLTVNFPGIAGAHVYVYNSNGVAGTVSGAQIASQTYKNNQAILTGLTNTTVDVVIVQGAKQIVVDAVDCTGATCTVDGIVATMTVKFPGINGAHTYVKVNDGAAGTAGGGAVVESTYKNNETALVVLKAVYDVIVVQGAKQLVIDAVDCASGACLVENLVATMTVKFPGISGAHTYVKVDNGVAGTATGGAVVESTYKNNETALVVLKAVYDVIVVQGAKQLVIDAVDCASGACLVENLVATMTVKFPGVNGAHTYVKVNDGAIGTAGGGAVVESTYKNNETALVVLKAVYDVIVVQGAKQLVIDAVDCASGACLVENLVATMTVKFPGINGAHTYVKVDNGVAGTATGGAVVESTYKNNETALVVLKAVYDVIVVQGAKQIVVDAVNCTSGACLVENLVATLTVKFTGFNGVHTYVKVDDGVAGTAAGGAVVESTYKNNETVLVLLRSFYDVILNNAGKNYIWDSVNCTGAICTLDKSNLTVDFPGISSVHVYVYNSNGVAGTVSGSAIASQTWKNNQAVFTGLNNGKYDVAVVKGAKTLIVDDVIVFGSNANAGDIVATLTVNFPGISSVHTYIKVNDGIAGAAGGAAVDERTWQNNTVSLPVLKSTYDIVVVKGSTQKIIDAVNCTGETCVVENLVATLTVNFPGISSVHTYVKVDDGGSGATGGAVDERTWQNNTVALAVLKNVYDVVVVKGAKSNIVNAVDCTGATCTVGDLVATLTVNFPGISSVHTYVKVDDSVAGAAGGGAVDERTWKTDTVALAVLKGTYDVTVVKGAKQKIVDAVDCTGLTCTVQDLVATLTIKFPGVSGVHNYIKLDDGVAGTATGGAVDERTWQNNQTSLALLKGWYDLVIVKGAKSNIVDSVDCTGVTCVIENLVSTFTLNFPGKTGVHVYLKVNDGSAGTVGGAVDERTWQNNATSFAVLKNSYDLVVKVDGVNYVVDAVDCAGTSSVYTLSIVKLLNSANAGIANGAVKYYDGSWHTVGNTDATGAIAFVRAGAPANLLFGMDYAFTHTEKWQNIATNIVIVFQTKKVEVQLKNSGGAFIDTGAVKYYTGAWHDLGNTTGGKVSAELLPANILFGMDNNFVHNEKWQDVGANTTVLFQTKNVVVQLKNSAGAFMDTGTVKYYTGAWHDFGATSSGQVSLELLPANILFSMDNNFVHNEKWQNTTGDATVVFQTKNVEVQLQKSDGTLFDTGAVQYYTGAWHAIGNTAGGKINIELLPANILFSIENNFVRNEKWQNTNTDPLVIFKTKQVIVQLQDHNGNALDTGTVKYYTGAWHNFGTTASGQVSLELLPANILFSMDYAFTNNQKWQNTTSNEIVVFKTTQVHSNSNTSTQYYTGAWHPFTNDMELLPSTILFHFTDGTPDSWYAVNGVTFNIH